MNPNFHEFYSLKGEILLKIGKSEKAYENFKQASCLLPTAKVHEMLGVIDLENGRKNEAIKHFTIASKTSSPAGKRAKDRLYSLDVETYPEKYIQTHYEISARGELLIEITNHSRLTVEGFSLQLIVKENFPQNKTFRISSKVPPSKRVFIHTGIYLERSFEASKERIQSKLLSIKLGKILHTDSK